MQVELLRLDREQFSFVQPKAFRHMATIVEPTLPLSRQDPLGVRANFQFTQQTNTMSQSNYTGYQKTGATRSPENFADVSKSSASMEQYWTHSLPPLPPYPQEQGVLVQDSLCGTASVMPDHNMTYTAQDCSTNALFNTPFTFAGEIPIPTTTQAQLAVAEGTYPTFSYEPTLSVHAHLLDANAQHHSFQTARTQPEMPYVQTPVQARWSNPPPTYEQHFEQVSPHRFEAKSFDFSGIDAPLSTQHLLSASPEITSDILSPFGVSGRDREFQQQYSFPFTTEAPLSVKHERTSVSEEGPMLQWPQQHAVAEPHVTHAFHSPPPYRHCQTQASVHTPAPAPLPAFAPAPAPAPVPAPVPAPAPPLLGRHSHFSGEPDLFGFRGYNPYQQRGYQHDIGVTGSMRFQRDFAFDSATIPESFNEQYSDSMDSFHLGKRPARSRVWSSVEGEIVEKRSSLESQSCHTYPFVDRAGSGTGLGASLQPSTAGSSNSSLQSPSLSISGGTHSPGSGFTFGPSSDPNITNVSRSNSSLTASTYASGASVHSSSTATAHGSTLATSGPSTSSGPGSAAAERKRTPSEERRARNNEASKRSRRNQKQKQEQLMRTLQHLEADNLVLNNRINHARNLVRTLRANAQQFMYNAPSIH